MKNLDTTKNRYLKILSLLSFSIFQILSISAQERNFSLNLSYGNAWDTEKTQLSNEYFTEILPTSLFGISGVYSFTKNFEAGLYFNTTKLRTISRLEYTEDNSSSMGSGGDKTMAYYFGLNANYQLLPLLMSEQNMRISLYAKAVVGMVYHGWRESFGNQPPVTLSEESFEYGAGLGTTYLFSSKWGVFGEILFGDFHNDQRFRYHAGLKFKF